MKSTALFLSTLVALTALIAGSSIQAAETAGTPAVEPSPAAPVPKPPAKPKSPREVLRAQLIELAHQDGYIAPEQADAAEAALIRMRAQEPLETADWRPMVEMSMRLWRFDAIERYRLDPVAATATDRVDLPTAVNGREQPGAPLWTLDPDKATLDHSAEPLNGRTRLLVVFHPGCGFCKRFAAESEADLSMTAFMRSCSRWVGTVDQGFSVKEYGGWTKSHPNLPLRFLRDWGTIGIEPTYTTPTMLLVKDGKVVDRHLGWPREGAKANLVAWLAKHDWSFATRCDA